MKNSSTLCYLHIPFCDSKCHYCAFNSYVDRFEMREAYMQAVVKQLRRDLERYDIQEGQIATLFIGGGTPSTVASELYAPFFETLSPYLSDEAEITTEANPNSATRKWLCGMRKLGVNRVSFGVQSFFDDKLAFLGRAHRAEKAKEATFAAADAGFARISLDLIYATILDTPARIEKELQEALALPIEHLSAYELTIEEGTPFQNRPEVRKESLEQARLIAEITHTKGWEHYEVSNYGQTPCRHNMGYWEYRPYLGIGSGAAGRIGHVRLYPHTLPEAYIDDPFFKAIEPLDEEAIREEKVLLGLRSVVGVDADILKPHHLARCKMLEEEGKLRYHEGRYCNDDFWLSDEIALFILG